MKDLIEALNIFLSVRDVTFPTHCEHDELMVCGYSEDEFSPEQLARLDELGFKWNGEWFYSFRFGSC